MLIRQPQQVEQQPMTMPGAQSVTMRLLIGRNDGASNFAMRLFDVAPGGHTPHHHHDYEHEIMILQGRGEIASGDTRRPVQAGDIVFIQPNELHQFRNTADQILRFMCMVPTEFDCGGTKQPTPGS